MKLDVKSASGADAGTVDVPDELFGITPNTAVMHQVVTAQLAAARSGHPQHQDPGRGPRWRREAVAPEGHRPRPSRFHPRASLARWWRCARPEAADYRQRTPKKMIRLALRSALSDRAAESQRAGGRRLGHRRAAHEGGARAARHAGLRTKGERDDRVLLVLDRNEEAVWKSFRNLGNRVQLVLPDELNTYDVLVNDWLVFSKATLDAAVARFAPTAVDDEAAETGDAANERQEPPRHHHPAGRVGEVVRRVRRERLHVRRRARRQQDRDQARHRARSSASRSPT